MGHLSVPEADGEVHIKYGMRAGDSIIVIKIATGFYQNPSRGIPSSGGMFVVLDGLTGESKAVLLENGYLTDLRTAFAGLISAKYLASEIVSGVAILGTGSQARLQVEFLEHVTSCRTLAIWGRDAGRSQTLAPNLETRGWRVTQCKTAEQAVELSNLIVTATTSQSPLFRGNALQPGTHVTALGADGGGKRELDSEALRRATIICADSRFQCAEFGELSHGIRKGSMTMESIRELGEVIEQKVVSRTETDISVIDLTGVAIQDIQIAKSVCAAVGLM